MRHKKTTAISKLLDESAEAYYWNGFIAADGCIRKNRDLKIKLANKDLAHLNKLKRFIGYFGRGQREFTSMDSNIVPLIAKKFGYQGDKTRQPCDTSFIQDDDLFLAFLIGFIDGDGCIQNPDGRKDASVSIKVHSNWKNELQSYSNRLCGMVDLPPNKASINAAGYAYLSFSNCVVVRFLKQKALALSLPILRRKWDRIDETLVSRVEIGAERKQAVKELLGQRMRKLDISKRLGITPGAVSQIISRDRSFFEGVDYDGKHERRSYRSAVETER